MQVVEVESFCLADPVFYDTESRWDTEETTFAPARGPIPDGWTRSDRDVWVTMAPSGHHMPPQGWKIHVSTCVDNCVRVVDVVNRYCVEHRIPHKFLRGHNVVRAHNLKYADRSYSGKVLTIYPDPSQLRRVLEELSAQLAGEPGPYILTDLRWGDGPLYVRYGGFVDRYCSDEDGFLVPAVERPDGTLVPDSRAPVFMLPDWVPLPDFLAPHAAARSDPGPVDFPYQIERALHFSNGGGVYLGRRNSDGHQVVLKEARPHAGLDGTGLDAIARLRIERDALSRLAGVAGVPGLYDYRVVWEHEFLVQEHLPGETLFDWIGDNYPLIRAEPTVAAICAYTTRAVAIADQIAHIVAAIHDRGMVIGDLHPNNILVTDDDRISLIDLETAGDADAGSNRGLGLPGFYAPGKSGVAADRHAVAAIRLWLLIPLHQLAEMAPDKIPAFLAEAVERFAPPPAYVAEIRSELLPGHASPAPAQGVGGTVRFEADWSITQKSIVEAILLSATPERDDRLFPGDVRQFATEGGGVTLGYGAAGVLWALYKAGAGRHEAYEEWLLAAVKRTPIPRPGLYDGWWGLAFVLDELGHQDVASSLVERAVELTRRLDDVSLQSGLAGAGLATLHFADRYADPVRTDQALQLAERLAVATNSGQPHGIDRLSGGLPGIGSMGALAGLMRGWSGVAWYFLRMHEHTGDAGFLDLAFTALHRDLDLCLPGPDGSLLVDGGFRLLPYLQVGSAGIALVGAEALRHRDDERMAVGLPLLVRALTPEFIVESQLGNGRAGLIATLARIGELRPDIVDPACVDRHLRRLHWHAVTYRGQLAFPGGMLRRLSMDLITGGAGVMMAIRAAVCSETAFLPLLERSSSLGRR